MKRVFMMIVVSSFVVVAASSCKKCTTCVATKTGFNDYKIPEYCGLKKDVDDYKQSMLNNPPEGYETIVCTDN